MPSLKTLFQSFTEQLLPEKSPHRTKLTNNLRNGLEVRNDQEIHLQSGLIKRVFDDIGDEALSSMLNLQVNANRLRTMIFENKQDVLNQNLEQLILDLTTAASKQILTPNGKLQPDLVQFLDSFCPPDDLFSVKFSKLSRENQEHVKKSLIFSLAHAEIMAVMKGCLADLGNKQDNESLNQMEKVAKTLSNVQEQIDKAMIAMKEERKLETDLLIFLKDCVTPQANQKGLPQGVQLNSEAKRLNKLYHLDLKFDLRRLINNPQDQMIRFIGKNHPDIITEITKHYKGCYERGEVNPKQAAQVLRKAGAENAAKDFETFVEHWNTLKSPTPPRRAP